MNDPTPFERLQADNADLRARLQLADERAFEQGATIARLRSLLRAAKPLVEWHEGRSDAHDAIVDQVRAEVKS